MTLRSVVPCMPFALILLALGAFSAPARADVHLVQVNEYYTQCDNGSTNVQYIELQPFVVDQFFRQCASIEIKRTVAGPNLFFAKPVFVGHTDGEVFSIQKTFLLATASFQTLTGITPDLVIPDGILDPAGGVIRFAADSGCAFNFGTIDLVAYGDQGVDPAPGPNQAANLTGFGLAFALGAPSPKNFAGATSSSWTCRATGVEPSSSYTFSLNQNIPNPFNPTTTISFTLPERMSVTLAIYDVEGRQVRTLVDESMGEGRHEYVWDGRNANGNPVSSGLYFYRLTAGKQTLTKKMVLLK